MNMPTTINNYKGDKIMITLYGGKQIIYSLNIIGYVFIELLYIKEFSYNTYNAFEMKDNKSGICECRYPGFKIIESIL